MMERGPQEDIALRAQHMVAIRKLPSLARLAAYVDANLSQLTVKPLVTSVKLLSDMAWREGKIPLGAADAALLQRLLEPLGGRAA